MEKVQYLNMLGWDSNIFQVVTAEELIPLDFDKDLAISEAKLSPISDPNGRSHFGNGAYIMEKELYVSSLPQATPNVPEPPAPEPESPLPPEPQKSQAAASTPPPPPEVPLSDQHKENIAKLEAAGWVKGSDNGYTSPSGIQINKDTVAIMVPQAIDGIIIMGAVDEPVKSEPENSFSVCSRFKSEQVYCKEQCAYCQEEETGVNPLKDKTRKNVPQQKAPEVEMVSIDLAKTQLLGISPDFKLDDNKSVVMGDLVITNSELENMSKTAFDDFYEKAVARHDNALAKAKDAEAKRKSAEEEAAKTKAEKEKALEKAEVEKQNKLAIEKAKEIELEEKAKAEAEAVEKTEKEAKELAEAKANNEAAKKEREKVEAEYQEKKKANLEAEKAKEDNAEEKVEKSEKLFPIEQLEDPNNPLPETNGFFSSLVGLGFQQLNIGITKDESGSLVVIVKPVNFSGDKALDQLRPLTLQATPEELDEGFFEAITPVMETTKNVMLDAKQYLDDLLEKKKATETAKAKAEQVKKLVAAAEKYHSKEDYDVTKTGTRNTTKKKWDAVLELDPENKEGLAGLQKLREAMEGAQLPVKFGG